MPSSIRPGDVLADRYRLVDLLTESGGGRFWRAHDRVLERHVALHVIAADDDRADALIDAARRSATVHDRRLLRVLDADTADGLCYVVNEWGSGDSLDIMLASGGPLGPRRAAWLVSEVAASIAAGHEAGVAHGRLIPENVLVDHSGSVRLIGFAVDAAMHGLPPGRPSTDVADLGGILYCALTGKWPGRSESALAPAPVVQGQVLRPRQVRAGIPKPLDALCDEVVNPYGGAWGARLRDTHDVATAQGIADYLCAFVGDSTAIAEAEAAAGHRDPDTITLPAISDPPVREPVPDPEPDPEPEPDPQPEPLAPADIPTQAGLPIFDDENDDVSWLVARSEPVPPPPPFEEPPERPLFAPEPADGPVRKPREPVESTAPEATGDFWPWSTGTGRPPPPPAEVPTDDEVPGRSWLRLAAVVAACLLLLVAIVVAYNLGRGRTPLGAVPADDPDQTTTPSAPATSAAPAEPIEGIVATDFDPQGAPSFEESPDLAELAVDGKPGTSWRTSTYFQDFGPGGLKTGVGLILDLGETYDVREVDLTFVGAPTGYSLFVTDRAPSAIQGLEPVATGVAERPRAAVELDRPAPGRFVTVWITSLPEVEGGFRAEVAEVVVRG